MTKSKALSESFVAIQWNAGTLTLLDQRKLPEEEIYIDYHYARDVADAIADMVVRGAPAIGIVAAYAIVLAAHVAYQQAQDGWRKVIEPELQYLAEARPTAVNLQWAIAEMCKLFDSIRGNPGPILSEVAQRIHHDNITANYEMSRLGASLIKPNSRVITHCNTGTLATGAYGTALGVIRTACKQDLVEQIYISETRPLLQGARLTSWELQQDHISANLVIDSSIARLMQTDKIQWLIVGSDRIVANGDVANKIGTYSHAIAAKYHGVKVMVVAPSSTVDMSTLSGDKIPIEYRDPMEIAYINQRQITPRTTNIINPAFDVTPAKLIDVIVTEKGILYQPDVEKMLAIFG